MTKCLGCGITLQNKDNTKLGYITNDNTNICERCFRLKNYGEYQAVCLNNEDYNKIIKSIPEYSLILYITDILTLDLSNLPNNPNTILVLTKYDILPKSTKESKIIAKLKEEYKDILDIVVVSSIKNYNIDLLYNIINKHSKGKDIYLIGNTNSGKSTLLNKLIKNYSNGDNPNITVSMYPSTTLDKVEIKINNLKFIDTPGLIDDNSYISILSKKDLKKVTPKNEINPRSCQINGVGSLLIDNLARIDYETKESNSIVIYTAKTISTDFISYTKNTYKDLTPHKYSLTNNKDIVLPGLGFIKCTKPINITIYTPKNIKPIIRNNLI